MENLDNHLKDISEIRTMMERSSKFLSLSGLSGISAGVVALIGAFIANNLIKGEDIFQLRVPLQYSLLLLGAIVLILSLVLATIFSIRMAKKKNLSIWNNTSKWMLASLFVPLSVGGLFCLILTYHGLFYLVAPSTLIFYGLSLLNASKYTVTEIRYLALSEIALGLIACFWVPYGIFFWAIGFGLFHILYGTLLYYKYEK